MTKQNIGNPSFSDALPNFEEEEDEDRRKAKQLNFSELPNESLPRKELKHKSAAWVDTLNLGRGWLGPRSADMDPACFRTPKKVKPQHVSRILNPGK